MSRALKAQLYSLLPRMAESSQGLTHARLNWTAQWHILDESYAAALASIVDYHHVLPQSAIWGPGTGSSSNGQCYRASAKGEAPADYNAKYSSDSRPVFYTHVLDRYISFHNKVIVANAGKAAHVIDGLLDHESSSISRSTRSTLQALSIMSLSCAIRSDSGSRRAFVISERDDFIP